MPSQFVQFSSSDVGGPGLLTGQDGALLTILDACLVIGYSGHTISPAWSKPFANSGGIGCYKQGAGAGLSLLVNDHGPNGTSTYKEAWAVGWESIAGIGAPVGTGSGQFPTPAQQLTTGHVVIRKSSTADTATHYWQMFADSSTAYLFISNGDAVGQYCIFGYGDVFSLKGASDAYRCMIMGRFTENSAGTGQTVDSTDALNMITIGGVLAAPLTNVALAGHYMARTYGGGGSSIVFVKLPDQSKMPSAIALGTWPILGAIQTPNGPDNSLYLAPIQVVEPTTGLVRGRLRGLYQVCHPIASFADGQTFSGGGDYAGKTFQIVAKGYNGGFYAVEISATVETN